MDIVANTIEETASKKRGRKPIFKTPLLPPSEAREPLWLSVSEAAKISGVGTKTIRRAIENNVIKFKVINNRYLINFSSLAAYLYKTTKLRNKFLQHGIGQYVETWRAI